VAAGLLPAACSRPGATPGAPATDLDTASAESSAPPAPPRFRWAGHGPVPGTPGKAMLGAYLGLSNTTLTGSLALRRRQLGRDERIVHWYYGWTDPLPESFPELPRGAVPMISWRGPTYGTVTSGSADDRIRSAARGFARYGRPVLLRFAWEMNGDWYEWCAPRNHNDIDGFKAVWRRVHSVFREEGADNVSWVWAPNWNSRPDEPWNDLTNYYPGDRYVDWVGVSGYPWHRETPETLFGTIYAEYAKRKPLMLAEVAGIDRGGSTKADWIDLLRAWVDEHPALAALVWFDTDTHPWTTENFRVDSSPEALAAYRELARDPRFAG
jgi:hypothetical protein